MTDHASAAMQPSTALRGRGVMQSYGAGQALADLIARGRYGAFDASALARDRFARGALAFEALHI